MTRLRAASSFLLLALAVSGCARTLPALHSGPPTLPPLEPGLAHYAVGLALDPGAGTLAARYRLTFVAGAATSDSAAFVLNAGLTPEEVSGTGVAGFRSEPSPAWEGWNQLWVAFDGSVSPGDTVTLEFRYAGRPEVPGRQLSAEGVELNLDAMWHPVSADFSQMIVGEMRLALPEGWTLVSGGSARREGAELVVRSVVPLPDVAFLAAPDLARLADDRIEVFHRGNEEEAATVLRSAEACGAILDREFGDARPLPPVRIVIAGREAGGGYARVNYIVLNEVPAQRRSLDHYLCHELAHHWTDVGDFMSPDHWMSEAFAEYVAARATREMYGVDAFEEMIARWEALGRTHGPIWTPEATRRPGEMEMYRRAPALLHRLERRMGREAFDRFLRRYMVEEVRTTGELLERLREVGGEATADWFVAELGRGPDPLVAP